MPLGIAPLSLSDGPAVAAAASPGLNETALPVAIAALAAPACLRNFLRSVFMLVSPVTVRALSSYSATRSRTRAPAAQHARFLLGRVLPCRVRRRLAVPLARRGEIDRAQRTFAQE